MHFKSDELNLIGTIEDAENDTTNLGAEQEESDEENIPTRKKKKIKIVQNSFFDGFRATDLPIDDVEEESEHVKGAFESAIQSSTTLDEKIAKVRQQKYKQRLSKGSDLVMSDEESDKDDEPPEDWSSSEENHIVKDTVKEKLKKKKAKKMKKSKNGISTMELDEPKITYDEIVDSFDRFKSFQDFDLRRPLQKALTALNYHRPTIIQAATISRALKGRDICACSATGTGKTAAFMIPILERLLYRDTKTPVTRVLVLAPTRELAIQIYEESKKLALFTDIRISLSAGGLDIKAQEAALRQSPDIVIATPGRLIDHLRNAPSFNLANIEVLVLDEADRMLDEFFLEQMKEVMRMCSHNRQTMLFSATMTENVNTLTTVSLNNPVKIFVNNNKDIAFNLQQEFVRIRPHMEGDREAVVAALIKRTFRSQCIVFIQTKKEAHRMHLVLGLVGIKVGELHGNLSQVQRLDALKRFKDGEIDVLIATDLAARGLDIDGVKTVINLTMPSNIERYIHRVGRTARAGKSGRSISLSGEKERNLLHDICKRSLKAGRPVMCRTVPQKVIEKYRNRIKELEPDIERIEKQEKEERELRIAENQINRVQNKVENKEDLSRPNRTWFQSKQERVKELVAQKLGKFSGSGKQQKGASKKAGGKKPSTPLDRVEYELQKAAAFSVRSSKRKLKDRPIRAFEDESGDRQTNKKKKKNKTKVKSSFDRELTSTNKKALKQFRNGNDRSSEKTFGGKSKGNKSRSKGNPKKAGNNRNRADGR